MVQYCNEVRELTRRIGADDMVRILADDEKLLETSWLTFE
jgi:hypothetical protein